MYVCDLFQKRMKQGIENAKTISATIQQNNDAITKMYSDAYAARQASEDKLAAKFSDYIRGLSRWQSPNQQYPVQLPSGYQYAWTNPSGEYVLSNDANFNPNVGSNFNLAGAETDEVNLAIPAVLRILLACSYNKGCHHGHPCDPF